MRIPCVHQAPVWLLVSQGALPLSLAITHRPEADLLEKAMHRVLTLEMQREEKVRKLIAKKQRLAREYGGSVRSVSPDRKGE